MSRFPPPWSVEASRIIALSQRIMELNAVNGIVGVRLSECVMTRLASRASTSGRGLLTFIQPQSFELSFSVRALLRLSTPPPRTDRGIGRLLCRDGQRRAESARAVVRRSDGLLHRLPPNQEPTMLVEAYGRKASVQHEGECNDESSCSRSSRLDPFSGCRISPGGVSQLRPRTLWLRLHSYGSALRLCRSSLVGTGPHGAAWVRATDLRTTTLRTDSCLPSASG